MRTGILEQLVTAAVADGQAPGIVAGVARGNDLEVAVAGALSLEGPALQRDSLFRISSMTKPITAAAVLCGIEQGRLDFADRVDRWLPELADRRVLRSPDSPLDDTDPARRPITVRDLLTFTWGFGLQGAMFAADPPWPVFQAAAERDLHTFGPPQPALTPDPDTWLARLGELPLLAQPGERWLYNTGSQVLGVLLARIFGRPLETVLKETVLEPLGMRDTAFSAADPTRLVTAYDNWGDGLTASDPPDGQWAQPPVFQDGGAGLVSNIDDLLAFGRMLLAGGASVLTPASVAQMRTNQLTPAQQSRVWPGGDLLDGRGWGFGVAVAENGSYGWDGGLGTSWANRPTDNLTVVVLTQRAANQHGMPPVCDAVLHAALSARS